MAPSNLFEGDAIGSPTLPQGGAFYCRDAWPCVSTSVCPSSRNRRDWPDGEN